MDELLLVWVSIGAGYDPLDREVRSGMADDDAGFAVACAVPDATGA